MSARWLAAGMAMASCLALVSASGGTTLAAFSDTKGVSGAIVAGVWAPDPPAECNDILKHKDASIVWGTPGDDVLYGGNHPQVLMGLGGNDVLHAGNQSDCLVGGDGDDRLFGTNAKDVLLGGPGNDYLDGGNAKDHLDGGPDVDTCLGGNGKDTIVNCEAAQLPSERFVAPLKAPLEQPAPSDDSGADAPAPQGVEPPAEGAPAPTADESPENNTPASTAPAPTEQLAPEPAGSAQPETVLETPAVPEPDAAGAAENALPAATS